MEFDVNWLAVIVATIAHQALGAIWYSLLFRDIWMRAMGMTPEKIEAQGPGGEMVFGVVASFLSVLALAVIIASSGATGGAAGLCWGLVTGVAFVFASTVMNGVYEQKKWVTMVLFGSYYTLGLMIAGFILASWQ